MTLRPMTRRTAAPASTWRATRSATARRGPWPPPYGQSTAASTPTASQLRPCTPGPQRKWRFPHHHIAVHTQPPPNAPSPTAVTRLALLHLGSREEQEERETCAHAAASLNVSERREWEERAERGPAPGGGKQRHGKSEVERRVIFIDRGSGGGTCHKAVALFDGKPKRWQYSRERTYFRQRPRLP